MVAASLCAGMGYAAVKSQHPRRLMPITVALVLSIAVGVFMQSRPSQQPYSELARVLRNLRLRRTARIPSALLSQSLGPLLLAGKPVLLTDPFIYGQLVQHGKWSDSTLIRLVNEHYFDAILTTVESRNIKTGRRDRLAAIAAGSNGPPLSPGEEVPLPRQLHDPRTESLRRFPRMQPAALLRYDQVPMLVLASASPRRQELLRNAGISFTVEPADIDERPHRGRVSSRLRRASRARESPRGVCNARPQDYVLGADTVVAVDDIILGKPVDAADAARMLRLLSGRTHQVITGVCLVGRAVTTRTGD